VTSCPLVVAKRNAGVCITTFPSPTSGFLELSFHPAGGVVV
jgi:hypothetical protein